jgi:DNA-binding beta-propeller fold protein YncE
VPLRHLADVPLPPHAGPGGFDHAAVHRASGRIYVAHTANDTVDVIDVAARRCVAAVPGLPGVAGVLVSDADDLVFTSNRGAGTVAWFRPDAPADALTVPVGAGPNGLAYDPGRRRLLAAGTAAPYTVSVVDVARRARVADVPVPGRTRWALYDPVADAFHVNIADPPLIAVLDAGDPVVVRRTVAVPGAGPHGLDLDVAGRRLFCACDGGRLVEVDADTGAVGRQAPLAGVPDVVFFDAAARRLYVAIGDPGIVEVFDTDALERVERAVTGPGAHTLAFDPGSGLVAAFLPHGHRAALYLDRP